MKQSTVRLSEKGLRALSNLNDIKNICEEELGDWLGVNDTYIPERLIPIKAIWLLATGDEAVAEEQPVAIAEAAAVAGDEAVAEEQPVAIAEVLAVAGDEAGAEEQPVAIAEVPALNPLWAVVTIEVPPAKDLNDVAHNHPFVILDTETNGIHAGAEICQIAVIDWQGKVLLDTLVKPYNGIPDGATRIHGISEAMVLNAPTFPVVHEQLYDILNGRHVVVYNAKFDRGMLHKSAEAWDMPKTEWKEISSWWCAMEEFAVEYGEWNEYHQSYKWQKLSTAAAFYGIPVVDAHSALGDCKMTLEVVRRMYGVGSWKNQNANT